MSPYIYPFLFFLIIVFTFIEATFTSWMIHDALRDARNYNPDCSIYPIPLHKAAITLLLTTSFWTVLTASAFFLASIGPSLTVAAGIKAKSAVCAWTILTALLWLIAIVSYRAAHTQAPLPGYSEETLGLPKGIIQGFAWASFLLCLFTAVIAFRIALIDTTTQRQIIQRHEQAEREKRFPYIEKLSSSSWIALIGSVRSKESKESSTSL
ncbi:hypothetical protein FRC17_000747 [Serendipita sp. 399]|nr:hypothetical protein FRC17_000747 [Serendipita sp. 399]